MGAAFFPVVHGASDVGLGDAALASQAAYCGRKLEQSMQLGDRELALIWQATMFSITKLRQARRFGTDTQAVAGSVHGR